MPKRIEVTAYGGPEVLEWVDFEPRPPGADEVKIRHTAIGLNYIDVYVRKGIYPTPEMPFCPGLEATGVVEEVGPRVESLAPGDRVVYGMGVGSAYSEVNTVPVHRMVKLPDEIDDRTAAAMMLKGMTAQYLLRRTYPVQASDTVLIHAAAGGTGVILCQWARHLGARVIGTVSSEEKAAFAKAHGCEYPIVYTKEKVVSRVREITRGDGVNVVYDSVGAATWEWSLDCLAPLGMLVIFGQSSGPVPPISVDKLRIGGSLFLTRPTLVHYTQKRKDLLATADELFHVVTTGIVKIEIGQTYPLAEAARAHADLEARKTKGSTVLLP